jgi:hypothetical protein
MVLFCSGPMCPMPAAWKATCEEEEEDDKDEEDEKDNKAHFLRLGQIYIHDENKRFAERQQLKDRLDLLTFLPPAWTMASSAMHPQVCTSLWLGCVIMALEISCGIS